MKRIVLIVVCKMKGAWSHPHHLENSAHGEREIILFLVPVRGGTTKKGGR
jgi:hypothetical protein